MTLIEVMIVILILGLIAGSVAVAVFRQHARAQLLVSRLGARAMRTAAAAWRVEHPGDECPTPTRLRDDQLIDAGSKLTDAWDTPYRIVCRPTETVVVSLGPDRRESDDDLVEPEAVAVAMAP